MEVVARVAMLELSTSFRRHVNHTTPARHVRADVSAAPRDAEWRGKLHELARPQSVGGSFDYGLLTTIGEVMCRTIRDDALPS